MESLTGNRIGKAAFLACAGLALFVIGCGENCADAARMGDFEFSQGNYENAIRQYQRASRSIH